MFPPFPGSNRANENDRYQMMVASGIAAAKAGDKEQAQPAFESHGMAAH